MLNIDWQEEFNIIDGLALEAMEKEEKKLREAGPKYIVAGTYLFDNCGMAIIKFRKRNTDFYRAYKKWFKEFYYKDPKGIFHNYPAPTGQEYNVAKAGCQAVVEYLNKNYNADAYVVARVD